MQFHEAFHASLLASALDCIIVSDDEGRIIEWNKASEQTFGYSADEVRGKKMSELIVPEEMREAHSSGMKRYLRTREAHVIGKRIEITALHAEGHTFPVELAIKPFEYDGRTWFVASLRDLTETRQIRLEREQEQRFYQAVLDAMPTQLAVFSPDGVYSYVTPSAISDSSIREWVIGKTDLEYCLYRGIPEAVAAQRLQIIREVAASAQPHNFEESFVGTDARTHHFIRYVTPVIDEQGTVTHVLGYGLDVTELKQNQIELRLREQAIMSSSNGIIITDPRQPDNPIVFVNPAFERITGYTADEVLGRNPRFLQGEDVDQEELKELRRALKEQNACSVVLRNYGKGGALYYTELYISPIHDDEGSLTHYVGIQTDVSDRIEFETRLKQARDLAVEADRAKSEFLAIMSHEIRTPMNGVIGATELLLTTPLDHRQRGFIETIRRSGDILLSVINDILDFSKIEAGKFELNYQNFELARSVESALMLCRDTARRKGLRLTSRIDPSVPRRVRSDPSRLGQVLVNLINNSVKFTEQGDVSVHVRSTDEGKHCRLHFTVRDTGIGMTPEFLEHAFEAFAQEDSSTARSYGGTGLGLAISARLVELLGGTISVQSVLGEGSTFRFSILTSVDDSEGSGSTGQGARHENAHFSSMKALVVEDNPINRQLLVAMLEELGVTSEAVECGSDAIAALHARAFDIVFMDIQMPGMDGRETTKIIRKEIPPERQPVIVALTASVLLGERQRSIDAGMNDFLTKPLRMDGLVSVLSKWAPESKPRPSAAVPDLLDREMISQILAMREGRSLMRSLVASFDAQVPELFEQLRLAIASDDADTVARTAHRLSSASGTIGLRELAQQASALESAASIPEAKLSESSLKQLEALLESSRLAIKEYCRMIDRE